MRKMQRSDGLRHTISSDADGGSYSQVARPVSPMTGKEDETGRRPSLKGEMCEMRSDELRRARFWGLRRYFRTQSSCQLRHDF